MNCAASCGSVEADSRQALFSILISALTTGYTSASISYDYDTDPTKRRISPDFYGYVPDEGDSRVVTLLCMIFNCTLMLLIRSISMVRARAKRVEASERALTRRKQIASLREASREFPSHSNEPYSPPINPSVCITIVSSHQPSLTLAANSLAGCSFTHTSLVPLSSTLARRRFCCS